MMPPEISSDEPMRLAALREMKLVDTPLQERFERITRIAKRLLDVDIAAISLVEADRQWFLSIQGLNECETSRDVSFCGHTILDSKLTIIPDAREDDRFVDNPLVVGPPNIVFYAGSPVVSRDGHAIGTICVIDSKPRVLNEEDLQCLQDLAALVENELQSASANAMQAFLLEEVTVERRRAQIDSLTRMWNRDGILRLAQEAIARTRAGQQGSAFVMVDLDEFKAVNDTFGHAAGDEVLRASSRRMLSALRESDVLGRIGGDEFLLVLSPCDSEKTAELVATRVTQRLTASPITSGKNQIPVAASIGVQYVEPHSKRSLESILKRSDAALYDAKRAGRACVAVATDNNESP